MGLSIVRVQELPLGRRVLRFGDRGNDVKALQNALQGAGFYFGAADGLFGTLTAEAVLMMQKAFGLKPDGVAGPEFYRKLSGTGIQVPHRPGRIVYSVKKQESLTALSQRFGVREAAWESLSGQGNPQKRIYPGMKLFLPEKFFFTWEEQRAQPAGGNPAAVPCSGAIRPGWRLRAEEELSLEPLPQAGETAGYRSIAAAEAVWEEIFRSRRGWNRVAAKIRSLPEAGLVFDLRNAAWGTIKEWPGFFKCCAGKTGLNGGKAMALLPLHAGPGGAVNRVFWTQLNLLAPYFRFLLFEPAAAWENPAECEKQFCQLPQLFRKLNQTGLAAQSLWIEGTGGWVWRTETTDGATTPVRETAPFGEAQRIRAMFPKGVRVSASTKLTTVEFLRRGVKNILIYRDGQGWLEFVKQIGRSNLAGLVIRGFSDLRDTGPAAIQGAFAVKPGK